MLFKELFRKYIFALYENHPKTLTEPVNNMDEAMFPKQYQDNIMIKLSIIYLCLAMAWKSVIFISKLSIIM